MSAGVALGLRLSEDGNHPSQQWSTRGFTMLLQFRSARSVGGKRAEALAWAKEVAATINQGIGPTRPYEVFSELFGEFARIYWIVGWEDWAQFEKWRAWMKTDAKIAALLNQSHEAQLFVADSWRDTLLETT